MQLCTVVYVCRCMRVCEEICHSFDVEEGVTLLCHATVVKKSHDYPGKRYITVETLVQRRQFFNK